MEKIKNTGWQEIDPSKASWFSKCLLECDIIKDLHVWQISGNPKEYIQANFFVLNLDRKSGVWWESSFTYEPPKPPSHPNPEHRSKLVLIKTSFNFNPKNPTVKNNYKEEKIPLDIHASDEDIDYGEENFLYLVKIPVSENTNYIINNLEELDQIWKNVIDNQENKTEYEYHIDPQDEDMGGIGLTDENEIFRDEPAVFLSFSEMRSVIPDEELESKIANVDTILQALLRSAAVAQYCAENFDELR
jgi:hypothetical protein